MEWHLLLQFVNHIAGLDSYSSPPPSSSEITQSTQVRSSEQSQSTPDGSTEPSYVTTEISTLSNLTGTNRLRSTHFSISQRLKILNKSQFLVVFCYCFNIFTNVTIFENTLLRLALCQRKKNSHGTGS